MLSGLYAEYYRSDNSQLHPLTAASYAQTLRSLEKAGAPGRLLDVGCGAGQFLEAARGRGWYVEGTELAPSAQPYLAARDLLAHFEELPSIEGEARYDAITMLEVIEHLQNPQAYLAAAFRLLAPGGCLYLTTPNFDGLTRLVLGGLWRSIAPEHILYYRRPTLAGALSRAGFTDVRIRSKNLDLADLRHNLCRQADRGVHSNIATTTKMREQIAAWWPLRAGKAATNLFLGMLGIGDSLEAWARRQS